MITVETRKKASLRELRYKDYTDYKRVLELYDKWDVAAKSKDFHSTEHFERQIKRIHDKHRVEET